MGAGAKDEKGKSLDELVAETMRASDDPEAIADREKKDALCRAQHAAAGVAGRRMATVDPEREAQVSACVLDMKGGTSWREATQQMRRSENVEDRTDTAPATPRFKDYHGYDDLPNWVRFSFWAEALLAAQPPNAPTLLLASFNELSHIEQWRLVAFHPSLTPFLRSAHRSATGDTGR